MSSEILVRLRKALRVLFGRDKAHRVQLFPDSPLVKYLTFEEVVEGWREAQRWYLRECEEHRELREQFNALLEERRALLEEEAYE